MSSEAETAVKLPAIEHIKARKDGLDVLADIYRYAELGFDAIDPDDLALFRWYGIYTQRAEASADAGEPGPSEETDGHFMLRIKFPGGVLTSEQLRTVGRLSERYGRGMGDITTRQNIQLHWLTIEDLPVVLDELNAVGLSFTQACGDVWRNVVGCPLAGVDGHELLDSRPLVAELEQTFVGNRRFSNLPRKFKVSVSGCVHRCAQHEINDIGLVAVEHEGTLGYDVWVGGGLGASARLGRRLDVFVEPGEAVEVCAAITEIYRDEGRRTKRTRARIKFLVDEWGTERLREAVEARLGRELRRSVEPAGAVDPHRDHLGIHPQVQPGLYYLGGSTLRGRFTAGQMIGAADVADRFGSGRLRCTNRQNIIVLDVPDEHVEEAAASLADIGLPTQVSTFRRGVISCTGMQFCKLAIVETKDRAAELIDHLERRVGDLAGSLRINVNGCPNACAQYQVADIGLQGGIARLEDGSRVQGFILHVGGQLGAEAGFGAAGVVEGDPGRADPLRGGADRPRLRRRAAHRRHLRRLGGGPVRHAAGGAGGRRGCPRAGGRGRLTATVRD